MKKLTIIFTILIGLSHFSNAQIIDSLPYFKQEQFFSKTIKPLFNAVIYNEGVAALRSHIDPGFTPPAKGWMKKEFVEPLGYYLGQAYSSNNQAKLLDEFEQTMVVLQSQHEQEAEISGVVFFEMPDGQGFTGKGTTRSAFDAMRYITKWGPDTPMFLKSKFSDLDRVFALAFIEKPDGQFLIVPDASQLAGFGSFGTKSFKGTDEELQAAKRTADNFLRAIRENDKKAFRAAFGNSANIEEVWTDMRPLSFYRNLPEYVTHDLEFERVASFENQAGWRGHFSTHIAVYRLPEGMKASAVRAPTDFLNPVTFPALDGSNKEPAYVIEPTVSGFVKIPDNYYETIFGGPLIGTVIGNEGSPDEYITVILKREPGTNNFNIGMPPSLK